MNYHNRYSSCRTLPLTKEAITFGMKSTFCIDTRQHSIASHVNIYLLFYSCKWNFGLIFRTNATLIRIINWFTKRELNQNSKAGWKPKIWRSISKNIIRCDHTSRTFSRIKVIITLQQIQTSMTKEHPDIVDCINSTKIYIGIEISIRKCDVLGTPIVIY